jgi:hypothetical protein
MSAKRQKVAPYTANLKKVKILADLGYILEDWPGNQSEIQFYSHNDIIRTAHEQMPGKNIETVYQKAALYYPEITYGTGPRLAMTDFLTNLTAIIDRELQCLDYELYGGLASSAEREAVLHIHAKLGGVAPRLADLVVLARRKETIFECIVPRWLRDDAVFSMETYTEHNPANLAFFFASLEEFVKTGAGNASFKRDYVLVKFWNYSHDSGDYISMTQSWTISHARCERHFYAEHAHLFGNVRPSVSVILSLRIREENAKYARAHPNTRDLTPFYRDLYVRERLQFVIWYFGKVLEVRSTNVLHTLYNLCPAL